MSKSDSAEVEQIGVYWKQFNAMLASTPNPTERRGKLATMNITLPRVLDRMNQQLDLEESGQRSSEPSAGGASRPATRDLWRKALKRPSNGDGEQAGTNKQARVKAAWQRGLKSQP